MSRILIVSPGSPCRNPRPLKEAQTLAGAGHDVTLLTLSESDSWDRQEQALLARAPFHHAAVPRAAHGPGRLLRRVRTRLARALNRAGGSSLHSLGDCAALRDEIRRRPADLTIVHNEIPHWIGAGLIAEGRLVAADFEDWHSEDLLPPDRRGRPLPALRRIEGTLLRQAAYVSTTSRAMADALVQRYGGAAPVVLTNSFPLQPAPPARPAADAPTLFWFSQTVGAGRGLEAFCAAWARTTVPSRLVLLGEVHPDFAARLRSLLAPGQRERLQFHPLVPPDALPATIAVHDLGLALEQKEIVNRDLTITNKILQYLNAGLGVIATPTAGQREVLTAAPGAGLLVDLHHPAALARQLDTLLADRTRLSAMGIAARRAAETTYCWEHEAPRLRAAVAAALSRPAART